MHSTWPIQRGYRLFLLLEVMLCGQNPEKLPKAVSDAVIALQ